MLEQDAFALSPFGIVVTDKHGCILSLNPAACDLFNCEPASAIGQSAIAMLPAFFDHNGEYRAAD